jgi:hypothetical protein
MKRFLIALLLLVSSVVYGASPYPNSTVFSGVSFDFPNLIIDAENSDLWVMTWGNDNNAYGAWGDGGGFGATSEYTCRTGTGLAIITGTPQSYTGDNRSGCAASGTGCLSGATHLAACDADYGTSLNCCPTDLIDFDGTLYLLKYLREAEPAWKQTIKYSTNYGQTWSSCAVEWEAAEGNFSPSGFVHFGKGSEHAFDNNLYILGYMNSDTDVGTYLARVPKDNVCTAASYQFYTSTSPASPTWGSWANAEPIEWDENYSISGHMYYVAALDRYLLLQPNGYWGMGNFSVMDSPNPWGPWTTVYYADDWGGYDNTTTVLWHSLIEKWGSADGLTQYVAFSGLDSYDQLMIVKMTLQPYVTGTGRYRNSGRFNHR